MTGKKSVQSVLGPSIIFLKLSGVWPKCLNNQKLSSPAWKNITLGNIFIISLGIVGCCYHFGRTISGSTTTFKLVSFLSSSMQTVINLTNLIYILIKQQELKCIIDNLKGIVNGIKKKNLIKFYFFLVVNFIFVVFSLIIFLSLFDKTKLGIKFISSLIHFYINIVICSCYNQLFVCICILFSEYFNKSFTSTELHLTELQNVQLSFNNFVALYSCILFLSYTMMISKIIVIIPVIIIILNRSQNSIYFYYLVNKSLFEIWVVGYLTISASHIQRRFQDFRDNLRAKIAAKNVQSSEDCLQRIYFLHFLSEMNFDFNIWGFFIVDRKLFITLFINVITFAVIVLQYAN